MGETPLDSDTSTVDDSARQARESKPRMRTRPLRVAVVADAPGRAMGGVARSVVGVTRELAQLDPRRLEVTIVASTPPDRLPGVRFRRSWAPRVPKLPDSLFALQRPFVLGGYDVVHYMDSRPPLDFPLGRRLNVVTQHGFAPLIFGEDYFTKRQRYVNRVLLRLAPLADLTFTASESERRELLAQAALDPSRVIAIHHGVDHDRFLPRPRSEATAAVRKRFGVEGRYVFYASNHQRKKNTERLVEAFARVAAETPDVSLVLVGFHTPSFALVTSLIDRLRIGDRVRVLGHVPDETLPALYRAAAVFALPSLHEGFGLPVLEAMACGTPVVASNVYALPEVCGDAAELVDPYDVQGIADALLRVLEDPARATELSGRGLERARHFTWRRSAERHLEEYERALAR
jgi:glycosyltransferase involved in cell wall biosynthesis